MSVYEHVASQPDGLRRLAAARLRYAALKALHAALEESGMTQTDVAARLGIRKSAVNQVFRGDGNVRMNTFAEYLHELGFEAHIELVPLGTARSETRDLVQQSHCESVPADGDAIPVIPQVQRRESAKFRA